MFPDHQFTDKEVAALRRMVRLSLNEPINTPNLQGPPDTIHTSSETYIVLTPPAGIPPSIYEDMITGTVGFLPSSALCAVYRQVKSGSPTNLISASGNREVYNASTQTIPGNTYLLAWRDKFGTWWTTPQLSIPDCCANTGTGTGTGTSCCNTTPSSPYVSEVVYNCPDFIIRTFQLGLCLDTTTGQIAQCEGNVSEQVANPNEPCPIPPPATTECVGYTGPVITRSVGATGNACATGIGTGTQGKGIICSSGSTKIPLTVYFNGTTYNANLRLPITNEEPYRAFGSSQLSVYAVTSPNLTLENNCIITVGGGINLAGGSQALFSSAIPIEPGAFLTNITIHVPGTGPGGGLHKAPWPGAFLITLRGSTSAFGAISFGAVWNPTSEVYEATFTSRADDQRYGFIFTPSIHSIATVSITDVNGNLIASSNSISVTPNGDINFSITVPKGYTILDPVGTGTGTVLLCQGGTIGGSGSCEVCCGTGTGTGTGTGGGYVCITTVLGNGSGVSGGSQIIKNCVWVPKNGHYATYAECHAICASPPPPPPPPPPNTSYNCVEYVGCEEVAGTGGEFAGITTCEEYCNSGIVGTYRCIGDECVGTEWALGSYSSLTACEEACIVGAKTWKCIDNKCVNTVHGSLSTCRTPCVPTTSIQPPPLDGRRRPGGLITSAGQVQVGTQEQIQIKPPTRVRSSIKTTPKQRLQNPPCAYRGGLVAPPSGAKKKGRQWVQCRHPDKPLKSKEDPTGNAVCSCIGCGPKCPGYIITLPESFVQDKAKVELSQASTPVPVRTPLTVRTTGPCRFESGTIAAYYQESAPDPESRHIRECLHGNHDLCTRGDWLGPRPQKPKGQFGPTVTPCVDCPDYRRIRPDANMPTVKWVYGITTVPERRETYLPRTLASLRTAGFDKPILFVDGHDNPESWRSEFGLEAVCRHPRIRLYGNWILGLWELFIRNPLADRYAMFQDDFVTYRNLRQYLELEYTPKTYQNLCTFNLYRNSPGGNEVRRPSTIGWYPSNQLGHGAVALVFDRETVQTLLSHWHMVHRIEDPRRGHEKIDGAVVEALCRQGKGWTEVVHNPSLVLHIGDKSSHSTNTYDPSSTFRGEEFDALELLKEKAATV